MHPQRFHHVVLVRRIFRIELRGPRLDGGHHVLRVARAQLDLGAIADAVLRLLQEVQQLWNRCAGDRRGLEKGPARIRDAIDAAVQVIARGVAEVVLHVPDDRVVPVGEVEGSVGTDLGIHRPEVLVGRAQNRLDLGDLQAGAIFTDLVVQQPSEPDRVERDEIALHRLGKVPAREQLRAADRPRPDVARLRRLLGLHRGEVLLGRERWPVVRLTAGRIEHDVPAPLVEDVAMRVREIEGHVGLEFPGSRLEPVDAAVVLARDRSPRRLDRCAVKDAFLKIQRAARIEGEAVDRVMGVGRVEAVQHELLGVVLVVSVRILQEDEVWLLCDEHSAIPELEAGRILEIAREDRALVGLAIAIGVLEDEQLVVHRRLRLPVGIVFPGRHPQPSLGVERHLNRLHQLGKLFLGREELDLEPLADRHRLDGLVAVLERRHARHVGLGIDERQRVRVVDGQVAAAGDCPDALVAVADHLVQDRQLALQHVVVAGQDVVFGDAGHLLRVDVSWVPANEGEERAVAVGRIAVGHAVTLKPEPIFVDDRLAQFRQQGLLVLRRVAEERPIDHLRDLTIAFRVEVDALDRQRSLVLGVEPGARRVEIDEGDVSGARGVGHRLGIERQTLVVLLAVWQVGIAEVFVRQRREQHDTRGRLAVVFLRERVRDPGSQLLFEGVETSLPGERLVVSEEGKDDVGLGVGAGEPVVFVAADRLGQPAQPFVGRAEVLRARTRGDFVAAESQIAHDELMLREPRLKHCLEPAVVLHPFGQRVADEADVILRLQGERLLTGEHRVALPARRHRP